MQTPGKADCQTVSILRGLSRTFAAPPRMPSAPTFASFPLSELPKNVGCFLAEKQQNDDCINTAFSGSVDLDNPKEDLYGREGYDQECTCWNDC